MYRNSAIVAPSVLVDATPLTSGHRFRGIGQYVRHLVRGVAERMPEGAYFLTLEDRLEDVPPARVVPVRSRIRLHFDEYWVLYSAAVRRAVEGSGCPVYHFTSAEASLMPGQGRTVATVYDLIPLETARRPTVDPKTLWRNILYKLYVRRLRAASHIIAISRATARAVVERLGIPDDRVSVVPLGIDHDEYRSRAGQRRAAVRDAYGLPERYWFTVTSPNPNKGWPDLVQALARMGNARPSIPVVIAGYWHPEQRRQLLNAAESLRVSDGVRFLGYVPEEDLAALYAEALGFVFPSRREGFGLPVLEAMAVGTPVVVSDDPALLELTGETALTFPRGDVAALADCLQQLASDGQARSALQRRGAERAAGFTWERTIDQTLAVYRAVASS
jgi:alpha-1,3-rhamnosyl/mannosyltransferase